MKKRTLFPICIYTLLLTGFALSGCHSSHKMLSEKAYEPPFFKIGHRGTRGLMPENTIPAMIKGIEVGANTIEMDVHITKDGKVIVYHDESFNPDYTTMPDGSDIPKKEREKYTFYQMNYAQIKPFVIGEKRDVHFPQQLKVKAHTPLLSELIDSVETFTKDRNLPAVNYLIEIKSSEKTDGFAQPAPEDFVRILMKVLGPKHLGKRLFLQSFDLRPLQVLHTKYPDIKLGFLTSSTKTTVNDNLSQLGFTPAFYNPYYKIITSDLIKTCHQRKIKVEPWTVDEPSEIKRLKDMGVDGIITDYPNLLSSLSL